MMRGFRSRAGQWPARHDLPQKRALKPSVYERPYR